MIDFRLNDHGRIELAEFGEETAIFLWQKCFPVLDEVLSSEDVLNHLSGDPDPVAANKIRAAIEHERKRLWYPESKRTEAGTAAAQELQVLLGKTGPVADCIAEHPGPKEEK